MFSASPSCPLPYPSLSRIPVIKEEWLPSCSGGAPRAGARTGHRHVTQQSSGASRMCAETKKTQNWSYLEASVGGAWKGEAPSQVCYFLESLGSNVNT